jgi:hypothetical protein
MTSISPPELSPMQSGKLSIMKRYVNEYAMYGFAISNFSGLEQGLLAVFTHIDERSVRDSINAYWSIGSPRGRYEWIDKRMKNMSHEDDFILSWTSIREKLHDAIIVRNQLAHGEFTPIMVAHDREIVGYWTHFAQAASEGELSFNSETQMIDGTNFFSVDTITDKGLEFISLSENLFAMVQRAKNL